MTGIEIAVLAGTVSKTAGALSDIALKKSRKTAIDLSARSQKLAIQLQEQSQKKDVFRTQKKLEEQLSNLSEQNKIYSYQTGTDVVSGSYALARSAGEVRQQNLETLDDIDLQSRIAEYNVDIEAQRSYANLASQNLQNVFNIASFGLEAFGEYSKGKKV